MYVTFKKKIFTFYLEFLISPNKAQEETLFWNETEQTLFKL